MGFEIQIGDVDTTCFNPAHIEIAAQTMVHAADSSEGLSVSFEVGLRLTNDAEIRELNHDFRGIDAPTDVLAFALREAPGGEAAPHLLGDIVISVDTARRQTKQSLDSELCFLFAHGLCHLLGYDHQSNDEQAAMDARCAQLLATAHLTANGELRKEPSA